MNVFDQMLSRYPIMTDNDKQNATYEVMQEIALGGLYRGGFFEQAAFYGGTCLRIFHSLERFSEDLDFSLISPNENFQLENYFPAIIEEFKATGISVEITKKDKRSFSTVESAFLKSDTQTYNVSLPNQKSIKIKIEVDINPPLAFSTEQKLLLHPFSFMARCYTLPDLYAGKMHALVFRGWKNRIKGRDWYDFEWYIKNGITLDFSHLHERIRQFNGKYMSRNDFINLLNEKLSTADIKAVRQDVMPYIKDHKALDIWSNEYFLQLATKIKFV